MAYQMKGWTEQVKQFYDIMNVVPKNCISEMQCTVVKEEISILKRAEHERTTRNACTGEHAVREEIMNSTIYRKKDC